MTTRITDRSLLDQPAVSDELVIVDKSDLTSSSDGTDKKITVKLLFDKAPVTHYNDATISKSLSRWMGEFNDSIANLLDNTKPATQTKAGIVRKATNQEAKGQSKTDAVLTASNLSALQATLTMMGLAKIAEPNDYKQGVKDDVMATPQGIFHNLLGTSVLGNNTQVFKIPFRNTSGDILMHLKVQFFTVETNSVATSSNPTNNYNHIHPHFDVSGTFPEPYSNQVIMVIPMGADVEGDTTSTGSDFWCRPHTNSLSDVVIRATRINGTGPKDPLEKIKVKCMVIGY